MTAAEAIGMLDRQLAAWGQPVTVRRYTDPQDPDRPRIELAGIAAFVRSVSADDVVGDIKVTASRVTVSPTDVASFWPLLDSDKIVIDGRERSVELVKPIRIGTALVRCDLVVKG